MLPFSLPDLVFVFIARNVLVFVFAFVFVFVFVFLTFVTPQFTGPCGSRLPGAGAANTSPRPLLRSPWGDAWLNEMKWQTKGKNPQIKICKNVTSEKESTWNNQKRWRMRQVKKNPLVESDKWHRLAERQLHSKIASANNSEDYLCGQSLKWRLYFLFYQPSSSFPLNVTWTWHSFSRTTRTSLNLLLQFIWTHFWYEDSISAFFLF